MTPKIAILAPVFLLCSCVTQAQVHSDIAGLIALGDNEFLQRREKREGSTVEELVVIGKLQNAEGVCWAPSRTYLIDRNPELEILSEPSVGEATVFVTSTRSCDLSDVRERKGIKTDSGLVKNIPHIAQLVHHQAGQNEYVASMCEPGSGIDSNLKSSSLFISEVFSQDINKYVAEVVSSENADVFLNFYIEQGSKGYITKQITCRHGLEN